MRYSEQKYKYLETYLDKDIYQLLLTYNSSATKNGTATLLKVLCVTGKLLHQPLNNGDTDNLIVALTYIRAYLCKKNSVGNAKKIFTKLIMFLKFTMENGLFPELTFESLTKSIDYKSFKQNFEFYKSALIPKEIASQFTDTLYLCTEESKLPKPSIEIDKRLKHIGTFLNADMNKLFSNYILRSSSSQQKLLMRKLVEYIGALSQSLNNNDTNELILNLTYIRIDIAKRHTYFSYRSLIKSIKSLIQHMVNNDFFKSGSTSSLNSFLNPEPKSLYETLKKELIPEDISVEFSYVISQEDIFKNTLRKCCTSQIARSLENHVNTFKVVKHHRAPIIKFLEQIHKSNPDWHLHSEIIRGELLTFRGNLLDKFHRNTAYSHFQNVKNSFLLLSRQGLLPSGLEVPNNLRRCTNTEKVRAKNPLICEINIYDDSKIKLYIDTPTFIESLKSDISKNLDSLIAVAKVIVYEGYKKFISIDKVIAQSQFDEFISHPELLVNKKIGNLGLKINPFSLVHPLRNENLTAYYNHYFDALTVGDIQHKITNLTICPENLGYLGLSSNVASAMQIIITEELGINPYSLYRVKISSDGHNQEFVQLTDDGSVRIKALKPRAKHARTRNAQDAINILSEVNAPNINAATCLKMALEMTHRTRECIGVKDLWICLSVKGTCISNIESFQTQFKKIRKLASSKYTNLEDATLKKVRTSKGVLIYLDSDGDSLKTANYFGNTVKTTLQRYIPSYLTELLFRVKIRKFQQVLLFMAVSGDESPAKSLNIENDDFNTQVKEMFNNPDMGGSLYKNLSSSTSKEIDNPLYFCLSDTNLQLAIIYAKHGENLELKQNCEKVINKVAQGPVLMKKMLRNAQISSEKKQLGANYESK